MKKVLVLMSFLVVLTSFMGAVSAVSLNSSDMALASSGVKNYTEANGHIPSYVDVNGKNSTTPSFLKSLTTYTAELGSGSTASVTIDNSVSTASNPSGSTTGKIYKAEYVDMASRASNFITTNDRVPNYSTSSLGNIRYESLVYAYSKIINYYDLNGRLPNYVTIVCYAGTSSTGITLPSNVYNTRTQKSFGTIQDAINDGTTLNGDTIVLGGTGYTENVVINKKITLTPVSGKNVIIQAANPSNPVIAVISCGAGSTIEDLTIEGSTNSTGILLYNVNTCNILGNIVTNNGVNNNCSGITLYYANSTSITQNNVTKNGLNGIEVDYSNNNTISRNNATNNIFNGIILYYANNNTVSNNNAANSNNGVGIGLDYADNNTISENTVTNNSLNGIELDNNSESNIISQNTVEYNKGRGILVYHANGNTCTGNSVTNNQYEGIYVESGNNTILSGNDVNINGLSGITISSGNMTVNTGYDGIFLDNSNSTNITENNATDNMGSGIDICNSNTNNILNNTITGNKLDGISIYNTNKTLISRNTVKNSSQIGINLYYANNTTITDNNVANNTLNGVYFYYANNNSLYGNNITSNGNGINLQYSYNNTLNGNNIINNKNYGIYISYSSGNINFNRIFGNGICGLSNEGTNVVDATDNWWGSNNPTVSSATGSDIYVYTGTVSYNPWLVLTVNSTYTSTGNADVTADLTHDNGGNDTSSNGTVPDGIPIDFNTTFGTVETTGYTGKGKARSQLIANTTQDTATITVTLDGQSVSETINLFPIYDLTTQKGFTSIQAAIDDSSTGNGDTIVIVSGTYTENIVLNKKLTLMPVTGGNVTIQSPNSSSNTITVNSGGSGSTIEDFTVGTICLNSASNCNITGNIINGECCLENSANNNTISKNIISSNRNGISIYNSNNNIITENSIFGDFNGVYIYNSPTTVLNFNRIIGYETGLEVDDNNGTVNAIDNWWGDNVPLVNVNVGSDIGVTNGSVSYDPWLVLTVTSADYVNGTSDVAADLTHDNSGNDTSPEGHVPDGIPVNFNTTFGTIETTGYTSNGKAKSKLDSNSTKGTATVTASLDWQNVSKTINLMGIYDTTTNKGFTSIQAAIDDPSTVNGDTIQVTSGTYTESIVLNKKLTLMPAAGCNVFLQDIYYSKLLDPNNPRSVVTGYEPVFTVNTSGSGSTIEGFTINGTVDLENVDNCSIYENSIIGKNGKIELDNSNNNTISENTLTGNPEGIELYYSNYNIVSGNTVTNSGNEGIYSQTSSNNIISCNTVVNSGCDGIFLSISNNTTISGNTLMNNRYGIRFYNSSATVNFNRITGNVYGLYNEGTGTVNAIDNWWGTNNPTVSSTSGSNVYIESGSVTYSPWLVLNVNVSTVNSGGNTTVTADLTHDNNGNDTSSEGHIPDGTPVNFTTNTGNIVGTVYMLSGQARTILNLGSAQSETVTVSGSLDNQNTSMTGVVVPGSAVLDITGTAIDNSTGQPLNITYTIPLNESVTWLSVLWSNTGMFSEEVQVILNGTVVMDRYFYNGAYATYKNSYSEGVFNAISYVNQNIASVSSDKLTAFWNYVASTYNLNATELAFVKDHRLEFIDNLTTNLNYPEDTFEGVNQILYVNGDSADYEGVRSFAIATTEISNSMMQYWLNQRSLYQPGNMRAAYGTFMTALTTLWLSDELADEMASRLNVTWARCMPTIVMGGVTVNGTYVSCFDPAMGMVSVGGVDNVRFFTFINSLMLSEVENGVLSSTGLNVNSTLSTIISGILNGETFLTFYDPTSNEMVLMLENNENYYIIINLETGLVLDITDVNGTIYKGATSSGDSYCYHSQLTTNICNAAQGFLNHVEEEIPDPKTWVGLAGGLLLVAGGIISGPIGWLCLLGGVVSCAYSSGLLDNIFSSNPGYMNAWNWLDFGFSLVSGGKEGIAKAAARPVIEDVGKGSVLVLKKPLENVATSTMRTYENSLQVMNKVTYATETTLGDTTIDAAREVIKDYGEDLGISYVIDEGKKILPTSI